MCIRDRGATGPQGATPAIAGSNTQIQFNNAGSLGASANLVWNGTGLGIGTASPGARLQVVSTASSGVYGAIIYNQSATGQGLTVRGGSTSSEDTFNCQTYDGGLALFTVLGNGNVVIPTGTLKTVSTISVGNATPSTSGAGITFPATQSASSDANTLDDYEEGTIDGNNLGLAYATPGTSSFTYSDRRGTYTKIGRVVYFTLDIRLASFSKGTASGTLFVIGLPFAQRNTSGYDSARCTAQLYNWTYTTSPIVAAVSSATTSINITRMVSNGVTVDIDDPNASSIIWVTGFYFV